MALLQGLMVVQALLVGVAALILTLVLEILLALAAAVSVC
jgi:hypothetical protein